MLARPMPWSAVLAMCTLLVGMAIAMSLQSVALAADAAFQLVRALGSGDVYVPLDARASAAWIHQGLVVAAARAGMTDTHELAVVLGIGQIVVPAIVWSLAIVLSRIDGLVCAVVSMVAALNAGATWFLSVNEVVQAAPLTVLLAVLLWIPGAWRWRHALLAVATAAVLVAIYETALLTGAVLTAWAVWRALRSEAPLGRYSSAIVAALSLVSVVVAAAGTRVGDKPTHSESLLYYVVSLSPWAFYVAIAGIAAVTLALGPWLTPAARYVVLTLGCGALAAAVLGLEPGDVTGFEARGGAAGLALLLELFLLWRWARPVPRAEAHGRSRLPLGVVAGIPVLFLVGVVAATVQPLRTWSESLDAFRAEVGMAQGVVPVDDVLPPNRRAVLWGWTSPSLSLLVRESPESGVLVDPNPSIVPFLPTEARSQIADEYTWDG